MNKKEPKLIPFGSLNTYQIPDAIKDEESTIAKNVIIDKTIGEIKAWGPWSKYTYPAGVTSFFEWNNNFYVQVGTTLYKNGVFLFTLAASDKLYYLPFTSTAGVQLMIMSNSGGSYKYDGTGITKLGVDGPVVAPVVTTESATLYRSYLTGHFASCLSTYDGSGFARSKGGIVTRTISGAPPLVATPTTYFSGKDMIELFYGMYSGFWSPGASQASKTDPLHLFYLTLNNHGSIDWSAITKLNLKLTSNLSFDANDLKVIFRSNTFNYNASGHRIYYDGISHNEGYPSAGIVWPSYPDYNASVIATISIPYAVNGNSTGNIEVDISSLTLLQKQSIRTMVIATRGFNFWPWRDWGTSYDAKPPGDLDIVLHYTFVAGASNIGKLNGDGYSWVYNYRNSLGVESQASPPSDEVRIINGKAVVTLSASLDNQVTNIILYRLGGLTTVFKKVVELANANQEYTDNKLDSELTTEYSSQDLGLPAIAGLKGLIHHLNRVFGYKGNEILNSEENEPEYWGDGLSNSIKVGDSNEVKGVASLGNALVIMKKDSGYVVPQIGQGTFGNPKSIPAIKSGLVSDDALAVGIGIYALTRGSIELITIADSTEVSMPVKNKFKGDPGMLIKAEGNLICTNPGLIINTELNLITEIDIANITYVGYFSGKLYIGFSNGTIYYTNPAGTEFPFPLEYKTKNFAFGFPNIYKYGRRFIVDVMISDTGTAKAEFYADDKLKYTKRLTPGTNNFSLPAFYKGKTLAVRFLATGDVTIKAPGMLLGDLPKTNYTQNGG